MGATTLWKVLNLRRSALIAGHLVAVGLLISWFLQPSAVDRVLQASPSKMPLPSLARPPPHTAPPLDLIQSRALFHASRTFYVPPPVLIAPVDLKPPPPAYKVAAVLISTHQPPVALLTDVQGKGFLKVRRGDVLAGWTVESVAPKRVTLNFQEERIELGPKLLAGQQNSTGNTAGSSFSASGALSTTTSSGGPFSRGPVVSAGPPPAGGLRVPGGSTVALGAGQATAAPRVYQPPPH